MKNSHIEWTTHTFNPWIGCTKVSPGCAHCYAETLMDTRYGRVKWGAGNPRVRTSDANWKQPRRWNREAEHATSRPRVFCASLADWLDDDHVPIEWLQDLFALIRATPNLDWLLLTKRPQNWKTRVASAILECRSACGGRCQWLQDWLNGAPPANVWIGTTVEDQVRANERIPALLLIPARVRFLSCEPLLGPVDLAVGDPKGRTAESYHSYIHWVICGGESGSKARPMHPEWASSLRDQCAAAGVAFHFKQWGEWAPSANWPEHETIPSGHVYYLDDARSDHRAMWRAGKKTAGRILDGRTWDELPTPA